MNILEWYFCFHPPTGPHKPGGSLYRALGHVEAFGYTMDETYLFFDPQGKRTDVLVTHLHDEINEETQRIYEASETIMKIPATKDKLRCPYRGHLTCVSQCAGLLGWRAYTIAGFKRKLLKNGAEVIHGRR